MGRKSKSKSNIRTGNGQGVKSGTKPGIDLLFILKPLLIGILGSIILIASYVALEFSWVGSLVFNDGLRNVYLAHLAILIFLIPVFMGSLTVMALSSQIKRYTYAIAVGMISGITAGIGFAATLSFLLAMVEASQSVIGGWQAIHDAFFSVPVSHLATYVSDVPTLLLFALLSVMLAGVGGSIFYMLSFYTRAKKSRMPGIIGKSHLRVIAYMAAALVILAIVPPILAFSGIKAGLVGSQAFHYPVTVQRLDNDTLAFTNNGGSQLSALDPASHFILYIGSATGGYDMSNQSAATGMNVTLDPAGGLGISPGSTLTIKGPGIAAVSFYRTNSSATNITHVYVIGNTTDGRELVYLTTFV